MGASTLTAPLPGPARSGPVRVLVDLSGAGDQLHTVRVLLVADVVRRCVEDVLGWKGSVAVADDGDAACELGAWARALRVRAPGAGSVGPTTDPADLLLTATGWRGGSDDGTGRDFPARRVLRVGGVSVSGQARPALADLRAHQPLAVRLALLRIPHADQAMLSSARLRRAEETLLRWRFRIASWRDLPPAPAPAGLIGGVRSALIDDLDTGAVLTALHRLEADQSVSSGSKLAVFNDADRVLALDLRHNVARVRR